MGGGLGSESSACILQSSSCDGGGGVQSRANSHVYHQCQHQGALHQRTCSSVIHATPSREMHYSKSSTLSLRSQGAIMAACQPAQPACNMSRSCCHVHACEPCLHRRKSRALSHVCFLQEKQFSESSTLSLRNQKSARLVSMAPDQVKLPSSYTSNSRQESAMLEHCRSFSNTFLEGYPHRPPPFLTPRFWRYVLPATMFCLCICPYG